MAPLPLGLHARDKKDCAACPQQDGTAAGRGTGADPMSTTSRNANGHRRREVVRWLKATGDHRCHICGMPIDMSLRFPDPMSWSCDEIVPVSLGGSPYDRDNVAEAHLVCNERRGNRMVVPKGLAGPEIHRTRQW